MLFDNCGSPRKTPSFNLSQMSAGDSKRRKAGAADAAELQDKSEEVDDCVGFEPLLKSGQKRSQRSGVLKRRSQSQEGYGMAVQISPQQYELMDREFKCPICRCVFAENPKWLPCQHVFCNDCLKQ